MQEATEAGQKISSVVSAVVVVNVVCEFTYATVLLFCDRMRLDDPIVMIARSSRLLLLGPP